MIKYTSYLPNDILPQQTPNEFEDDKIYNHLAEEHYWINGYVDLEEFRVRELIKNGKSQRIRQCL